VSFASHAFAAFDWHGYILKATVQFVESNTEALLKKFNLPVKGFSYPYTIKKISVDQDMVPQLRLFDD